MSKDSVLFDSSSASAVFVFLQDETSLWDLQMRREMGRCYGRYVYDRGRVVQGPQGEGCCRCHFAGTIAERPLNEADRQRLHDEDEDTPAVRQIEVRILDAAPLITPGQLPSGETGRWPVAGTVEEAVEAMG